MFWAILVSCEKPINSVRYLVKLIGERQISDLPIKKLVKMQAHKNFEKEIRIDQTLEPQAIKNDIFVLQSLSGFGSFKSISTGKMFVYPNSDIILQSLETLLDALTKRASSDSASSVISAVPFPFVFFLLSIFGIKPLDMRQAKTVITCCKENWKSKKKSQFLKKNNKIIKQLPFCV